MAVHQWAGLCARFLYVKKKFSIATVTKCLFTAGIEILHWVWSKPALFGKYHEITSIMIWCYINKLELHLNFCFLLAHQFFLALLDTTVMVKDSLRGSQTCFFECNYLPKNIKMTQFWHFSVNIFVYYRESSCRSIIMTAVLVQALALLGETSSFFMNTQGLCLSLDTEVFSFQQSVVKACPHLWNCWLGKFLSTQWGGKVLEKYSVSSLHRDLN